MSTPQATLVVPPGYLTLNDTVQALGRSIKTVERLVASGELESKLIPREGRKAERVYAVAAVERLKGDRERRVERRPPSVAVERRPAQLAIPPETITTLREAITQFLAPRPLSIDTKLWLTLDESVAYSGLAKGDLRRLIREGKLLARKSGGWRIRRASLEAFSG